MTNDVPPQLSKESQPEDEGTPLEWREELKWVGITVGLAIVMLTICFAIVKVCNAWPHTSP
jgi:hypothetical protein